MPERDDLPTYDFSGDFVESNQDVPTEVDWRKKGYVTNVKDQGSCGACWAFSATGAIEAVHFNKTGQLVSLSEQHLLDCTLGRCLGGWPDQALQYVIENHGIDTEASYPYEFHSGRCRYKSGKTGATISKVTRVGRGEYGLEAAVAKVGPVSVSINVVHDFFLYHGGIYTSHACAPFQPNHSLLVVGYGDLDGKAYWTLKNSWGPGWGMDGYVLMGKFQGNMCGIGSYPFYAEA